MVLLLIAPASLLVGLLDYALNGVWFSVPNFVYQVFILFFCLNLYDPKVALAHYFEASQQGDQQAAFRYGSEFLGDKEENDMVTLARDVTRKLFLDADRYIFSVLFWYILLGLFGASVYAMTCSFAVKKVDDTAIGSTAILIAAQKIHAVLDWIPTRIVGLTYALVGHLGYGFAYWQKHFSDGLKATREFAYGVGLAALERDTDYAVSADVEENKEALIMLKRTFTLWIVIIAIFTLVSWIA